MKIHRESNISKNGETLENVTCSSLPPLVNPTIEDATTYAFDRDVIFNNADDAIAWWKAVKESNAYYKDF